MDFGTVLLGRTLDAETSEHDLQERYDNRDSATCCRITIGRRGALASWQAAKKEECSFKGTEGREREGWGSRRGRRTVPRAAVDCTKNSERRRACLQLTPARIPQLHHPCLAVRQPFRDECGLEAERAGAMEVRMVQKEHSEGVDTGKSETSTITTLPPWICCQTKANIRVLLHCVCEVSHRTLRAFNFIAPSN